MGQEQLSNIPTISIEYNIVKNINFDIIDKLAENEIQKNVIKTFLFLNNIFRKCIIIFSVFILSFFTFKKLREIKSQK